MSFPFSTPRTAPPRLRVALPSRASAPKGRPRARSRAVYTTHTTYYYRALADNAKGEHAAPGKVEHFTTGPLEASIEGLEAKPVAETTATLHGVLNPGGPVNPASYEFVYRQSPTECEHEGAVEKATPATAAPGLEKEAVSAPVTGLLPGMPYTFCLRESNAAGEEALSTTVTFTTPAVAPTVESDFSTDVADTSATLGAEIDPGGKVEIVTCTKKGGKQTCTGKARDRPGEVHRPLRWRRARRSHAAEGRSRPHHLLWTWSRNRPVRS